VQGKITHVLDDVPCNQTVRAWRWPAGIACPACESTQVIPRGCDATEPARQRDACHAGHPRFAALTDTIFAGHHQPLKGWIFCLYSPLRKGHSRF